VSATDENEPKILVCPECGRGDELKSVEQVLGHLGVTLGVVANTQGKAELVFDFHDGTEMFWDTSETIGLHCRNCDYDDTGEGWEARFIAGQPELQEDS
jgi:hypothetical protein